MSDQQQSPSFDPATNPPPLPAAAPVKKKRRWLWWVLGGVAVMLLSLYAAVLWFAFKEIEQAAETAAERSRGYDPYGQTEPTGPINLRRIEKAEGAESLIFQAKLDDDLAAAVAYYRAAGFTEDRRFEPALLHAGGSEVVDFDLSADREHVVVAVCDDDCTDVDLTLIDENDNVIDEDYAVDARPAVTVLPAWTGTFHANVEMIDCLADDCLYTLALYSRPASVEARAPAGSNPKSD